MEILIIALILIGIIAAVVAYRARKDINTSRGSGGGKPDTHGNQHLK